MLNGITKKLSAPDTSVKKVNEKCVVEMFTWTLLESKNQRQNNYRRKMHCVRKRISLRVPRLGCRLLRQSKGLKVQLGSDKLLGIPLETYIPSEKLAIEFTNGSEHMEVLKSHLCKQRNIKLVKLPFKTTETEAEYADRVKAVFKSVHIFIYSDVEADVSVIRAKFNEWRKRL